MKLNTFWKQPAGGFSEKTRGRTEDEIQEREEQIGFKFPNTYRELMKLQNGGYLRKSSFEYNGKVQELLYNGATIDKINPSQIGYQNMLDVLSEWMDEEEINSVSDTEFNNLTRLPLISHMDGHSFMCFDYGWKEKEIKEEPKVCFFNDDFKEYLRLKNFDEFVSGLKYYGYESYEYYFGVKETTSIVDVKKELESKLDIEFIKKETNRGGWFNFDKWYQGELNLENDLHLFFQLSPNKFKSGNFLFQERKDIEVILGIMPTKNRTEALFNNSSKYLKVMKELFAKSGFQSSVAELLIPINKEEK